MALTIDPFGYEYRGEMKLYKLVLCVSTFPAKNEKKIINCIIIERIQGLQEIAKQNKKKRIAYQKLNFALVWIVISRDFLPVKTYGKDLYEKNMTANLSIICHSDYGSESETVKLINNIVRSRLIE